MTITKLKTTGFIFLLSLAGIACKKNKQDSSGIPEPFPLKSIKATVLEYGSDTPVPGADVYLCTSPLSPHQCDGELKRSATNLNGQAYFTAKQYTFGSVQTAGYFQNIHNLCFVKYLGADSMATFHTSDSFIVRIVPKTDFTLHIKDSSGQTPGNGVYLVADVNFHNCVNIQSAFRISLRPGIDTAITIRDLWGNTNYTIRVGRNYDFDCSCFGTGFYNQVKYVPKGNTNYFDIKF